MSSVSSAGLVSPDIRLAEHALVEGDVARGAEGDFCLALGMIRYSATSAKSLSLACRTRHGTSRSPLTRRFNAASKLLGLRRSTIGMSRV